MSNSLVVRKNSGNSLTILKSGSLSAIASLPPATNTTLGGIIVGDNLSITGNGVLSAQPGGVTAFNNRTGNVSLTSSDVTTALATPFSCLTFTGTSTSSPFNFKVQNANGSRYASLSSPSAGFVDLSWVINSTRNNGQIDTYYPFIRLFTDPFNPDINEGRLFLQYNYTANASTGPYFNTSIQISKTKAEFFAQTYTWTDNSLLIRSYADTRYATFDTIIGLMAVDSSLAININSLDVRLTDLEPLVDLKLPSANFTYANLTGKPTTLAGYGITDGLTSANLTPYLTTANATATYAVLGHTHSIANVTGLQTALDAKLESANFTYSNLTGKPSTFAPSAHTHAISEVTGLQTALDAKLPSANFTYANITGKPTLATVATSGNYTDLTGTPNLTVYLTTANAAATYSVLTHNHVIANVTGLQTALDSKLPSANFTYANLTGPQNLLDTELIRAKLRDYSETVSSPTISAGTLTLNLETSNIFTVSLNAAITTLTISNPPASGSGGSFTLIFTADGTARAVTWPASIKWAGGTAPTLTSTSGKVDSFAFFTSDGGTTWQGYVGGQNF